MKKIILILILQFLTNSAFSTTQLTTADFHRFLGWGCEQSLVAKQDPEDEEETPHYYDEDTSDGAYESPAYRDPGGSTDYGSYDGPMVLDGYLTTDQPIIFAKKRKGPKKKEEETPHYYDPEPTNRRNYESPAYRDTGRGSGGGSGDYDGPMYIGSWQDIAMTGLEPMPLYIEVPLERVPDEVSKKEDGKSQRGVRESDISGDDIYRDSYESNTLNI